MVNLVTDKAKAAICRILKIAVQDFSNYQMSNLKQNEINILEYQTTNFRIGLSATHMVTDSNDMCKLEKIQIYLGEFLNVLIDNPNFSEESKGGGNDRIINDLFFEGFQHMVASQGVSGSCV